MSHTQRHVNSADGGGFQSNHVFYRHKGAGTFRQSDWRAYNEQNAVFKGIINKDHQVAPKRTPLGAHLAVNTHNMGKCFVESVKNARWSMSPQEAGDGLDSIVEFQVQIKGHNQQEYEHKWQGWQNWTNEKLATKITKDGQQLVLLPPARWWPDTLPEFESEEWQRLQMRVKCWQCECSVVEDLGLRSSKCHGRKKQMKTKGKRLEGIVFHQCQSTI